MAIDGVSQSTGIERLVEISATEAGVRIVIRDRKLGTELAQVTVPADELMSVLTEQPKGGANHRGQRTGAGSRGSAKRGMARDRRAGRGRRA